MPAIPFPRTVAADVAGCEGHDLKPVRSIIRQPLPYCSLTCLRYGHNGSSFIEPAVTFTDGVPHCPHHRELLSADQIAAVDETAGHVGTVRAIQPAQVSQEVGGCDSVHTSSGEVSHE